jgi:tape measure domain-containing protein
MAVTVERLKVDLAFDTSSLRKGFGTASEGFGQMRSQAAAVGTSFSGLTTSILKAGAVVGGLKMAFNAAKSGLSLASTLEQNSVAFETMLGSADKAKSMIEGITKFAAATPFELPGLLDAGQKLLAFGVSQEQIIPTMRVLSSAYGKIVTIGTADLQDIKQIAEKGIPIFDELAKTMGVGRDQIKDLISKGKVGLPQIQAAFKSLTDEGGKFAGGTQKQATTLSGVWSTLKDNFNIGLAKISQSFIDAFDVKGMIVRLSGAIEWVSGTFIPAFASAFQTIASGFSTAISFITGIWDTFGGYITTSWSAYWTFVSSVFSTAWGFISSVATTAFNFLGSLFGGDSIGLVDWAGWIQAALLTVSFGFENWSAVVGLAATKVMHFVVMAANEIIFTFTDRIPAVLVWFADNWLNIFKTIGSFTTSVFKGLWENAKNFFTGLWNWVSSRGKEPFEFAWTRLTDSFESSLTELPNVAIRSEGELEKTLREQANGLQDSLSKDFDKYVAGKVQKIEFEKKALDKIVPPDAPTIPKFEIDNKPGTTKEEKKSGASGGKGSDEIKAATFGSADALSAITKFRNDAMVRGDKTADAHLKEARIQTKQNTDLIAAVNNIPRLSAARI